MERRWREILRGDGEGVVKEGSEEGVGNVGGDRGKKGDGQEEGVMGRDVEFELLERVKSRADELEELLRGIGGVSNE